MAIKVFENHFEGCEVGISAPSDANMDIGANRFVACGKSIDIRSPESLFGILGLTQDVPLEVLKEVLSFVGSGHRTELEISEKAKSIGLSKWLSVGADTATLIQGLSSISHLIPQILANIR